MKTGVSKGLTRTLDSLNAKERYLDEIIKFAKRNIKFTIKDPDMRTLSYVTRDDLLRCFEDQVVLTAKGLKKVERLPVMEDDVIVMGRGLRIVSQDEDRPIEVCLATDEGKALIKTNENDDYKPETTKASRKSKPNTMLPPAPNAQAIPSHWAGGQETDDHRVLLKKFQEYKQMANILLNYRTKNPIRERRYRLRNFYQGEWYILLVSSRTELIKNPLSAKTPFIKLIDTLGADYCFTLHDGEGVCDLFDIPVLRSMAAEACEEMVEEDEEEVVAETEILETEDLSM